MSKRVGRYVTSLPLSHKVERARERERERERESERERERDHIVFFCIIKIPDLFNGFTALQQLRAAF